MEEEKVYYLENDQTGVRLDKLLSDLDPDLTRSHAEQLIEAGKVSVNDKECRKGSYKGKEGDLIRVLIPEPEETEILPEKMDVPILYEDDDIIIVNKPKGMVVHPAPGHNTGTLVNGLLYHCKDSLSGINGNLRPGTGWLRLLPPVPLRHRPSWQKHRPVQKAGHGLCAKG